MRALQGETLISVHIFIGVHEHLRLGDDRVRRQLLQVVLQRSAPPLHKVSAGALALDRVLLRPRGDEVATVRRLQQVSQRLQRPSGRSTWVGQCISRRRGPSDVLLEPCRRSYTFCMPCTPASSARQREHPKPANSGALQVVFCKENHKVAQDPPQSL